MKSNAKKYLTLALCLLAVFVLWTVAVCLVNVQPIGPENSAVGFAGINGAFHRLTGVHMALYDITDILSVIPLGCVAAFGLLGLTQLIRRKDLRKVDSDLLVLGGFYVTVLAVFVLFEKLAVNYRPVLIEGVLEASYPSSTTTLVLCVMPSVMLQLHARMKAGADKNCVQALLAAFTAFMVIGRLVSGVHWLTDIVGSVLLSAGLFCIYKAVIVLFYKEKITREVL